MKEFGKYLSEFLAAIGFILAQWLVFYVEDHFDYIVADIRLLLYKLSGAVTWLFSTIGVI